MALSQHRGIRYVRGLVAVVVVSSVALSSGAVQAQTADTPVGSRAAQPNVFQLGEISRSGRASIVLLPRFSQSEELPGPGVQPSRRSGQGAGSHKVLAGVAGAMLGGLVGVAAGSAMNRNSHSADREMVGGMIGFPVGAAIGAVVLVKLAR
jgi:hypothetical protein